MLPLARALEVHNPALGIDLLVGQAGASSPAAAELMAEAQLMRSRHPAVPPSPESVGLADELLKFCQELLGLEKEENRDDDFVWLHKLGPCNGKVCRLEQFAAKARKLGQL